MLPISLVRGTSLASLNNSTPHPHSQHRESLIKSLANFITRGLSSTTTTPPPKGRIGSSLLPRLKLLHQNLPPRFQPVVESLLNNLPTIESLPWVLTHGDLVPSNIIITHPETAPTAPYLLTPDGLKLHILDTTTWKSSAPISPADYLSISSLTLPLPPTHLEPTILFYRALFNLHGSPSADIHDPRGRRG